MRRLIEYTLLTLDGVVEDPSTWGFTDYQDDAYLRDGLGLFEACDGWVMGRGIYESFSQIWPPLSGRQLWADRLNEIRKYVFSSTLKVAEWNNTAIVRGDAISEISKLKEQAGRDLFTWAHGPFAEALLRNDLIDAIEVSIVPVIKGDGRSFAQPGQSARMRLVSAKTFTKGMVRLSYERA